MEQEQDQSKGESKKPMPIWIWGVIGLVVVGIGFGLWYYNYKIRGATVQTSSSPTKTLAVSSPSPNVTGSPTDASGGGQTTTGGEQGAGGQGDTSNQGGQNNQTTTPATAAVSSGEFGPIADKPCVPAVTFNFPNDYNLTQVGPTPSSPMIIYIKGSNEEFTISAPEWAAGGTAGVQNHCTDYDSIQAVYNAETQYKQGVSQPNYKKVNGYQAVEWTYLGKRTIVLQNGDKYIEISGNPSSNHDLIVNSVKFL